jgi:hypothetical protein
MIVMRRYPGLLEAVLMNNADVPPVSNTSGLPGRYDQSLALLAERCERTPPVSGDPRGLVSAVDAKRQRLAVDPQRVTVPEPTDR